MMEEDNHCSGIAPVRTSKMVTYIGNLFGGTDHCSIEDYLASKLTQKHFLYNYVDCR